MSKAETDDTLERFDRLGLLLEKMSAISRLVDVTQQPHAEEIRLLCTQAGLLAIDLTQKGVSLDSVAHMVRAWKEEQVRLLNA